MSSGRYLLWFGVLVVCGLSLIGVAFWQVQRSILNQERRYMQSVARATASSIGNFLTGYENAARMMAQLPHFRTMSDALRTGGGTGSVLDYLNTFTAPEQFPAVADAFLMDKDGTLLSGTAFPTAYIPLQGHRVHPGDGKLGIYRNQGGDAHFLGFTTRVSDTLHLFILIDVGMMHKHTASFVSLGEKGYVMLKHSSGIIITHPAEEQVGWDVVETRKARYPDLDYADLEALIREQKSGREGLRVYYSYWWRDHSPARARKMSAFMPVPFQNDFIIVSAVNDYAELRQPILINSAINIASAVLIMTGLVVLLLARHRENQRQIERENVFLKELNRRREESRHNQRLQMIGTLAGGIAHEFRNLLTPIMGYSGILRETLPPDSPIRQDVDEMYTAAAKAKEIIQQITSLSRKNTDPEMEPISLDEVLSGILGVAMRFKPPGVRVRTAVDFGGALILGNDTQLDQIVLNLCNNAFQAMPDGGNVWIEGATVTDGEGKRFARLIVRDDGEGIDPAHLERIFDPFFTTKRTGEGTGLGLSVVQNIVDLHGGTIEVKSEGRAGAGATFILRFPAVAAQVGKRATSVRRRKPTVREVISVVLVEEDGPELRLLHRGLAKSGFTTQAFCDARTALDEIVRNPCRLLVVDYDMPGGAGVELAESVREKFPEIKILLLTGRSDERVAHFAEAGAVDAYQIKPVPVSELIERINSLFA